MTFFTDRPWTQRRRAQRPFGGDGTDSDDDGGVPASFARSFFPSTVGLSHSSEDDASDNSSEEPPEPPEREQGGTAAGQLFAGGLTEDRSVDHHTSSTRTEEAPAPAMRPRPRLPSSHGVGFPRPALCARGGSRRPVERNNLSMLGGAASDNCAAVSSSTSFHSDFGSQRPPQAEEAPVSAHTCACPADAPRNPQERPPPSAMSQHQPRVASIDEENALVAATCAQCDVMVSTMRVKLAQMRKQLPEVRERAAKARLAHAVAYCQLAELADALVHTDMPALRAFDDHITELCSDP